MQVLLSEEALELLRSLDMKSKGIIKKNLAKLSNPYPGRGVGDKERIVVDGEEMYRLHIGRTYTAFYVIDAARGLVRVIEILPIKDAHQRYGF